MRRRFLPKYVTAFVDRHGKERLRFRRTGFESHYFKSKLGTEEFRQEYRACLDGREVAIPVKVKRSAPGTIDDLVARYCSLPSRLGPTETTQRKIRGILEKFRKEHGHRTVADLEFEHVEAILQRKMERRKVGSRIEGGVEAARKLRKELVRLFDFAVKSRMIDRNPAALADRIKIAPGERSKGYYSWTESDIDQYRECHPLGSRARLAMELMLWTGQRRIDAIHLGPRHVATGRIELSQSKGGKVLGLPVAPQLLEAIVAMPPLPEGAECFLLNELGRPFTNAGFGNWFRDRCDEAGLHKCTAHGLRKAMMRRLADVETSQQGLKSVSGHSRDEEVAIYVRGAEQRRLAAAAIARVSDWEKLPETEKEDALAEAAKSALSAWKMSNLGES